jgi:linoleoyl-CoA desaturase
MCILCKKRTTLAKITFTNKDSAFFDSIKHDVNTYFEQKHISKTGDWRLYLKATILLTAFVGLYLTLLFVPMTWYMGLTLAGLFGLVCGAIGFNVMHDACHGSFSSKKWVNDLFGFSMNLLGSNAFIWKQKHNVIHHTYTNIDGVDDDIAKSPVLRHCSSQPKVSMHKYQHIYMFFLYALSTIIWMAYTDMDKYFKQKVYKTKMSPMDAKEHAIFWFSKALYLAIYIFIPIAVVGFMPWLWAFLAMNAVFGLMLSVVFQLAHVVEVTEFAEVRDDEEKKQFNDWAVHQILTTSDFAPKNKFVSWMVGGLNFQVEHHLFPRISHVHYPALQPIIKQNCEKFGVRYNCIDSMSSAVASHYRTMRMLGQD